MIGPGTNLWTADGNFNITADGRFGWKADGYEPTELFVAEVDAALVGRNIGVLTYVYDALVPLGWVITGYPPLLSSFPVGSFIPLTISQGPAPAVTTVTVPNVIGKYYYEANLALLQAGLLIAFPTFVLSSTVLPGYVTAQSLASGTIVGPQTLVTLTASGFSVTLQGVGPVPVP